MSLRDFAVITKGKPTKYVNYSVGQPMGLYSSWAAFTITHHLIVQLAAFRCGFTKLKGYYYFTRYAILGDDIVIANKRVAIEYRRILGLLDVSISASKSFQGEGIAEFAKSIYLNGCNVSSLP
jgi:hypothetical protein